MYRPALIILLLLLSLTKGFTQQGIPFIQNYDPETYKGSAQIWGIAQDNRGLMYFAADGVLEYDGVNWRNIPVKQNNTVRSLAHDSLNNIIFVGGVGDFGMLEPDSTGKLVYKSLAEELESDFKQFSDVWRTEVGKDGAYFSTDEYIFRYSVADRRKGKYPIKIWDSERDFFLLYNVKGEIYTGLRGQGFVHVMEDTLMPIPGNETLRKELVWFMLPYDDDKILIGNQESGLNIYDPSGGDNGKFIYKEPYLDAESVARTDSFLYENQLYGGAKLRDGRYALATIRSGIIIIDSKGKIVDHICKENGLQSQTVHFLFEDSDHGLWSALTYGISRVETGSPITQWNKLSGIDGSIYNVIRHNKQLYVSSNLGLFVLQKNKFEPVSRLTGPDAVQCFALERFAVSKYDTVFLVGASSGIFRIEGREAIPLLPLSTFEICHNPNQPSTCIVAEDNILMRIELKENKWIIRDTLVISEGYPNKFSVDNKNYLWYLEDNTVFRINLNNTDTQPELVTSNNLEFYRTSVYMGEVILLSDKGICRFDTNKGTIDVDTAFFCNGCLSNLEIVQLFATSDDDLWLSINSGGDGKVYKVSRKNGVSEIDSIPWKRLPVYDEIRPEDRNLLWIISPKALYQFENDRLDFRLKSKETLIRKISINNDSVLFSGVFYHDDAGIKMISERQNEDRIPVIDFKNNNLIFEYALPAFDNEDKNLYSYALTRGNSADKWSAWSHEKKKEYTNLDHGEYVFRVKARNIYGLESLPGEYRFIIKKPWYRTYMAFLGYLFIAVFIIWLIVRLYTLKLKKEKAMLEKVVRERTREIWEKKEEIKKQAESLQEANNSLLEKNQEINQQNAEIAAQRDNLEMMTEGLQQRNEEISTQRDELLSQRDIMMNQQEQLERINQDITDSIAYARRIQNSALTSGSFLAPHVSDYFIYYKPRDIISGDFYWFAHIENQTIIAVADCTGHGVPGALMSILGMSLLKEIVAREYITHPGVILRKMRKSIIEALHQKAGETDKDGMDMTVVTLVHEENMLQFAGANNPLYFVRSNDAEPIEASRTLKNENSTLYELKGDSMPIGIYVHMNKFTSHEFRYKPGDMFYLFTDGYSDQFGGEKNKKLKTKSFKHFLHNNSSLPFDKQKNLLDEFHVGWKGDIEQVDDILVLGVKL